MSSEQSHMTDFSKKHCIHYAQQVKGLVQMSDDEDDEPEPMIDDSLLVTNVTAESLGFTEQGSFGLGPSTSVLPATEKFGSTIVSTFPASMELTLQYLSGKISQRSI